MLELCVTSKIVAALQDGKRVPFEETLIFLKRTGFSEIDMSLEPPLLLSDDWESQLKERLRLCEREKVRIRYAHMPYHYPKEDNTAAWREFFIATCRAIDFAMQAGADCAAIHPHAFMTREYDPQKEYDHALRFLEPYQDYALKKGFTLALENMRGAGRDADPLIRRFGTEVRDVIALADALQMGVCWDTGHGNISGQNQREAITQIGPRLKMVHLNDNFALDDVHLALFLGNIDWNEVAEGLNAVHYQGSLNTEVHCNRLPDALRAPYAAYMAEAVQQLKQMMISQSRRDEHD